MSLMKRLLTRNVGGADRLVRALPFAIFVYVWATGALQGAGLIALGIVAAMLLITSITGMCSIYALFGISTCKTRSN